MTKFFSTLFVATSMLMVTAGAASADRIDQWDLTGFKTGLFATDCRNCEEDRGIDLECKFGSRRVDVSIPGASMNYGRKGRRTHVTIKVGDWKRVFRARMDYQGLIGYVPEFRIAIDSPLFSRLATGRTATITFQGQNTKLSLNGSARVLKRFVRGCRSQVAAR